MILFLELIKVIEKKGRHIERGKLIIGFDYRRSHAKIKKGIKRLNEYAQETGIEVTITKKLL